MLPVLALQKCMYQPKYSSSLYPVYLRVKGNLDNKFFKKSVPNLYFISNFKKFIPNFCVVRKHSCLGRSYVVSYVLSTISLVVIYVVKCILCINTNQFQKDAIFLVNFAFEKYSHFQIKAQKQWIVFSSWDVFSF